MRLLVVADVYVPSRISGALQLRDLTVELARQGHDVTVLVPSGDGLAVPTQTAQQDGVRVVRVAAPKTKDVHRARRLLAEVALPHHLWRAWQSLGLADSPLDGVIWYSPSIFLAPVVRRVMRHHRCPSYLIVRDLFPDWAVDAGVLRRGALYQFFKAVERDQYQLAGVIGVQTPANGPIVAKDAGSQPRIEVLNNWLTPQPLGPCSVDLAQTRLAGRVVLAYTGNMGSAQDLGAFLDLAASLRDRPDIGLLFVGRGSDALALAERAAREQLDNTLFLPEIEQREVPGLLAQCHVGIIALHPAHTTHNIPGKLITYLQAGLPVLARVNPGNDLVALVRSEQVGFAVEGDQPAALRDAALALAADAAGREAMGQRGRALAAAQFSPEAAARQVVAALAGQSRL